MAITVGENTYVTLIEANEYISGSYPSASTEYTSWNALSDGDKEIYLKNATKKIGRLPLKGIKAESTQDLAFPRAYRTNDVDEYYLRNTVFHKYWYVESEVTDEVKSAQIEEAISLLVNGNTNNNRANLIRQGVKKFKIGDLSEEYSNNTNILYNSLNSQIASELLMPFIANSTRIV